MSDGVTYTLTTQRHGWFRWEALLENQFGTLSNGPYWSRKRAYDEMYRLAASCGVYLKYQPAEPSKEAGK